MSGPDSPGWTAPKLMVPGLKTTERPIVRYSCAGRVSQRAGDVDEVQGVAWISQYFWTVAATRCSARRHAEPVAADRHVLAAWRHASQVQDEITARAERTRGNGDAEIGRGRSMEAFCRPDCGGARIGDCRGILIRTVASGELDGDHEERRGGRERDVCNRWLRTARQAERKERDRRADGCGRVGRSRKT